LELGGWVFGALIAFDLVILGALLTVGPVDLAIKIASAAFAVALPPDVAGFLFLRLMGDMKKVGLEDLATKAMAEAGFKFEERNPGPDAHAAFERRRTRVMLRYSYALLAAGLFLTLVGMTAALWHMAWWIGTVFVVMAIVSQVIVFMAIAATGSEGRWQPPTGGKRR
jgi:hypothetical protein